ncbi:hypothetical protein Pfo_026653 [Paulownia fortunei]|nr:hypothetical protein Pfo_026653 [Paulownia fortunei]
MGGGGTSKGKKQVEQPVIPRVKLSIKSQDGDIAYYRFMRDKRMQYLFSTYCKDKNLDYNAVAFVYNGQRIKATRSPAELGMEDEDEIDVMVHQNGGGYSSNPRNLKGV